MSLTLTDGLLIVAVIAGLLLMMAAVRYIGTRVALPPELQRKVIHVATGTAALIFPLLFSNPLPVFVLIGVALVLMLALRTSRLGGLGSVLHDVNRESYGEIYLALAIAIIFFRSHGEPVLYVLPILVITLSDTASALVGTSYGRRRFAVEDGSKSMEGVVAFFVVTWLCAMIALLLMTDAPRLNIVLLSLLIAAFCALVEADSGRGLDNLFVPIGAHMLLAQYLHSGPTQLIFMAIFFVGFAWLMAAFASTLRITDRAARGYSVLLFLVISSVSVHNAILPGIVIVAQILARWARPGDSPRPDLDLLAVATAVALFWLITGDATGRSVISLFNLSFAGAAIAFFALASSGGWRLALLPTGVALGAIFLWVVEMNLPYSRLFTPGWIVVAIALVVAAAVPISRPAWFSNHRSLKIFLPAMLVPIGLCLQGVFG
jgi:dolichol kinase